MQSFPRALKLACLTLALTTSPALVSNASAAEHSGHLYLVHFKASDAGAPATKEQAITLLDTMIIPSLAQLSQDRNVVAGGLLPGAREGSMIVRAASPEALTLFLRKLPAWGVWDWKVTPLEAFAHRAKLESEIVTQLKAK